MNHKDTRGLEYFLSVVSLCLCVFLYKRSQFPSMLNRIGIDTHTGIGFV